MQQMTGSDDRAVYYAGVVNFASRYAGALGSCGDPAIDAADVAQDVAVRLLERARDAHQPPVGDPMPGRALVAAVTRGKHVDRYRKRYGKDARYRVDSSDALVEDQGDGAFTDARVGSPTASDPLFILEKREELRESLTSLVQFHRDLVGRRGNEGKIIFAGLRDAKPYAEIVAEVRALCPGTKLTEAALRRLIYLAKRDDERLRYWLERRKAPDAPASRGGGSRRPVADGNAERDDDDGALHGHRAAA